MLMTAYPAIKSVDDDALVVAGALAPVRADAPPLKFLKRMYDAGAKGSFDVLSVHAYPPGDPRRCRRTRRVPTSEKDLCFVERYREVQRRNHDKTPIWLTEFGYGTAGPSSVDAADQARYLAEGFRAAQRYEYLRMVVWYSLRDLTQDPSTWLQSCGLVTSDFTEKPAFEACRRTANRLDRLRAVRAAG